MLHKKLNLRLFDAPAPVNTTDSSGLSAEMRTYYADLLKDYAKPNLVHDQFADKYPIPKNGGKTIEFRKYSSLPKALNKLVEGVTPAGKALNVTTMTATVAQYGDHVPLTDMVIQTAVDNNVVQATNVLGSQSGRTLDTVSREVLAGGTNVIYSSKWSGTTETPVTHRYDLDTTAKIVLADIFKGSRTLKTANAMPIDECFVGIVHPDIEYDLLMSDGFQEATKYANPEQLYKGEIGKFGNVRFVRSTEAKIFYGADLSASKRTLKVTSISSKTITVAEALTATEASALVGRELLITGVHYNVTAATAGTAGTATITVDSVPGTGAPVANDIVYPGEGGKEGIAVYSTLILGAHAYATTEIDGMGLQHIVKPLGYGDDPLNQRGSCGWKATKVSKRLVEEFMLRIESASTFSTSAVAN